MEGRDRIQYNNVEGRDRMQYNNFHKIHHSPSNVKASEESKSKIYYEEDMERKEQELSDLKYKSGHIDGSAKDATVHPERLYEADKLWQPKDGIFRVHHVGGYAEPCDGCVQELKDDRILKTTHGDQLTAPTPYSFNTHFDKYGVAAPHIDINYPQVSDYNRHSPGTSTNKHKVNINKFEKTEIPNLDHSDDALQFQIEESMSKMFGKNEFSNMNVPSRKSKEWGRDNMQGANDGRHNGYSTQHGITAANSNVDDIKINKIKFKNKIAVPCKERVEEGHQAQHSSAQHGNYKANNWHAAKPSSTEVYYGEGKETWNPGYQHNYKEPCAEDAAARSCDIQMKASSTKGFSDAVAKSEKYTAHTHDHEIDEWIGGNMHEHPALAHNEYVFNRKQKYDNRAGDPEEQMLSGKFYNQRLHPSSKVPLDYKPDKVYQLLQNIHGREKAKIGFENPAAHEHSKGFKVPFVAEHKQPLSKTADYKKTLELPYRNDGITEALQGHNEIKHYAHDNHYDHDYEDYHYVNKYLEATSAENRLHKDDIYEDHIDKVSFQDYHSENYSPNNRQNFYKKFALKEPVDITLHDRHTVVSAEEQKGHNIGDYTGQADDDVIGTNEKELKHYIGGIRYRPKKNNIRTNPSVSKAERHIWKGKERERSSSEYGAESSQDNLKYKANRSTDYSKPNEYYVPPHIAIKYFPANYHHYEGHYPLEKLNSHQPQGRPQRSPQAHPKHDLDSDNETQLQRPDEFEMSFEIEELSTGPAHDSTLRNNETQTVSDVQT
jgi:hypothetical protein